ncbi:hypothetical protein CYMTET_14483 [Cymbomonas tetramitiformis]|uniref:Kinesin motor domain-containing protein n=1 Tax=Cymbomonas tetramitiformis TaxID=36881 RepID=A0AAE0LAC1_9CHLO|nr:hypothetical protein CYMTET_14483 [Cymbomonas tetramitiformis]
MICNVSPSESSSGEILSSLRFAERTKKVENKARVNIDPKLEQLNALLKEQEELLTENARLASELEALHKENAKLRATLTDVMQEKCKKKGCGKCIIA